MNVESKRCHLQAFQRGENGAGVEGNAKNILATAGQDVSIFLCESVSCSSEFSCYIISTSVKMPKGDTLLHLAPGTVEMVRAFRRKPHFDPGLPIASLATLSILPAHFDP